VSSRHGRKRWILHERGNTPIVDTQQGMSYLQKQFLLLAYDEYGQDKSDVPASAQRHL